MDKKVEGQSISVIFPCYNEEKNIVKQLSSADAVLKRITDDYEIIVVNDGSTDKSAFLLKQLAKENDKIKVLSHEKNLFYGATLKTGFKAATKKLIFFTSMDNQYDFDQINGFLRYIGDYDVVIGYRLKRKDPLYRILIARTYNLFVRVMFGLKVRDIDCAFKLFRREVIDGLKIKSCYSFIDAEILLKVKGKGYSIKELDVRHYPRTCGLSTVGLGTMFLSLREIVKLRREFSQF